MVATNLENSVSDKVKQDILAAWKEGHGGSADRVHLLEGEEGLVLMIPKALYQAELDLHRTAAGSLVYGCGAAEPKLPAR